MRQGMGGWARFDLHRVQLMYSKTFTRDILWIHRVEGRAYRLQWTVVYWEDRLGW